MSFSDSQIRLLKARLNPDHVRSRIADGQILSYLEGWHVIAEANRIFGFDGWDRETLSSLACSPGSRGSLSRRLYRACEDHGAGRGPGHRARGLRGR